MLDLEGILLINFKVEILLSYRSCTDPVLTAPLNISLRNLRTLKLRHPSDSRFFQIQINSRLKINSKVTLPGLRDFIP